MPAAASSVEALAGARPGARAWILDTFGLLGSGKTKFLERLRAELPARRPTATFEIALSQADQLRGSEGRDLTKAAERFCDVVGRLVDDFVAQETERSEKEARRAMEPVTLALTNARKPVPTIQSSTRVFSIGSRWEQPTIGAVRAILSDTFVAQDIEKKQTALAEKLAETLPSALHGRSALVTIDGFEWVAGGPLGDWLLHLVNRLSDTVAVLARTPGGAAPVMTDADVVTKALPPLTSEEIATLLGSCLQTTDVDDRLVDVVKAFSKGHAQTVGLVAHLLERLEPAERDADAVKQRLQALPEDLAKEHGDLVDAILEHDGAEVAELVRCCSIVRRFDAALLEAVAGLEEGAGAAAVDELLRYSFVARVPDPRDGFFAVHDFIRAELEQRLTTTDPERARKRHVAAAEHIARWLADYEEGEFPDGQGLRRVVPLRAGGVAGGAAQSGSTTRPAAPAGRANARESAPGALRPSFFDAFCWWGCYAFPFIRTSSTTGEDPGRRRVDVPLVTFVAAYPTGYRKDSRAGALGEVDRSLRLVRGGLRARRRPGRTTGSSGTSAG